MRARMPDRCAGGKNDISPKNFSGIRVAERPHLIDSGAAKQLQTVPFETM